MNLRNVLDGLRAVNKIARPKFIQNSNYCSDDGCVSWYGYAAGIYKRTYYAKEYEDLLNGKQYSFLLRDNSFLQFYYEFDAVGLRKARLCYYPVPISSMEDRDTFLEYMESTGIDVFADLYLAQHDLVERGEYVVNTSHFRVDFDREVAAHSVSHIQFGGLNDFRIEADHLVNPFIFFDWIGQHAISEPLKSEFRDLVESAEYVAMKSSLRRHFLACATAGRCPHLTS